MSYLNEAVIPSLKPFNPSKCIDNLGGKFVQ